MQNSTNSGISQNDAQPKKAYQAPILTDHGTVKQLTQNSAGSVTDDGMGTSS